MVSTSYCDMKINIRDCTYNDSYNYYLKFIYGYPEKTFLKTLTKYSLTLSTLIMCY